MENENKKSEKSLFISKQIRGLRNKENRYCKKLKRLLNKESMMATIGYVPGNVSVDGEERSLFLSREIVNKIENDHGPICPENMIITVFEWEYAIVNVDNKPDRINLLKTIPESENYLVIAANRYNGFYTVTHFETESKNGNNLKRLLKRGNVVNRVSSVACTTDQDLDSSQTREVV
ncbi:hypothetical protein H7X65_00030 [Candidatus Parcubacteria bacterium]|nr:hypothetical protein [Candidatus Parcubacteria bacterium]